jgi:hypothetical protein
LVDTPSLRGVNIERAGIQAPLRFAARAEGNATECNEDAAAVECRLDLGKDFRRDRIG